MLTKETLEELRRRKAELQARDAALHARLHATVAEAIALPPELRNTPEREAEGWAFSDEVEALARDADELQADTAIAFDRGEHQA